MLLSEMLYLCASPMLNSKLLNTVKSFMAINQNKTNIMSDNYQQLWDLKYFHLQDTCRDWGGGEM